MSTNNREFPDEPLIDSIQWHSCSQVPSVMIHIFTIICSMFECMTNYNCICTRYAYQWCYVMLTDTWDLTKKKCMIIIKTQDDFVSACESVWWLKYNI